MSEEIKETEVVDVKSETAEVEAKYTQQDIDRIVGERLAREKAKSDKAVEEAKAEAERKKLEESNEFKALYESVQAELEKERQQAKQTRLQAVKQSLLLEAGYPSDKLADVIEYVSGDDDEAIKASIEKFAKAFPPKAPPVDPAVTGGGQRQQPTQKDAIERGRERFQALKSKGLIK